MKKLDLKNIIEHKEDYLNKEFVKENISTILKIIIVVAIIIFLCISIFFDKDGDIDIKSADDDKSKNSVEEVQENEDIFIDISGAVKNPTVLELPKDSRINDAIIAAGGLNENADISNINRAQLLEDGQKIYIPTFETSNQTANTSNQTPDTDNSKVNINTATSEELDTLNGIGPATAEKIIQYRETNGLFKSIEELKEVSGIGDKTFEKFKDDICI